MLNRPTYFESRISLSLLLRLRPLSHFLNLTNMVSYKSPKNLLSFHVHLFRLDIASSPLSAKEIGPTFVRSPV